MNQNRPTLGVSVKGATHWFVEQNADPQLVLQQVDLTIQPGEFITMVGPSGCGKTTLLNMIAGVTTPELGEVNIVVDGASQKPPLPSLGYMQARDALLPWRSLRANVELGLEFAGVRRPQRRERAEEALRLVGLGTSGDRYPRQLSQGMRQRGNLARLMATEPQLLLMDEPFGALDAQTKDGLQEEFLRIWQNRVTTVVFVTHDLAEAVLLGDRVVVMNGGRIVDDIRVPFARPRNLVELRFDAQFQELVRSLWPLLAPGVGSDKEHALLGGNLREV
jgi:NitT/TauT family transport system ATP-binding protein